MPGDGCDTYVYVAWHNTISHQNKYLWEIYLFVRYFILPHKIFNYVTKRTYKSLFCSLAS